MTCWRRFVPVWSFLCGLSLVPVTLADGPATWVDDLSPIAASEWNGGRASQLIERAGFGATPEDIARLAAMTPRRR